MCSDALRSAILTLEHGDKKGTGMADLGSHPGTDSKMSTRQLGRSQQYCHDAS